MKSLGLTTPHIVAMVGVPGAGKTYFATHFSEMFGAPHVDQELFHLLFTAMGDDEGFSVISRFLFEMMKTRQTIVYEGPLDKRIYRTDLSDFAKKSGYKVLFVWVQTNDNIARSRWQKNNRNEERSYDEVVKEFSPPHISENQVIISGRHTYGTQARTILKYLSVEQPQATTGQSKRSVSPRSARR